MPAAAISAAHCAAARQNGSKSKGPTTEEGNAISSLNRRPPGPRYARMRFLKTEDPALLEQMRQIRMHSFQSRDVFERDAVEAMARAEYHLTRLEGLYSDHALATQAGPYEMCDAMIRGQVGHDGYNDFGKWIEREERNLDRAHRRLIRHRTAMQRGLFEKVTNEPMSTALPEPPPPQKPTIEPTPPPQKIANEPRIPPALMTTTAATLPEPVKLADPRNAEAFYAEMLLHPKRETVDERVEILTFDQMQAVMAVIHSRGYLDRQPQQAYWLWKALLRRW